MLGGIFFFSLFAMRPVAGVVSLLIDGVCSMLMSEPSECRAALAAAILRVTIWKGTILSETRVKSADRDVTRESAHKACFVVCQVADSSSFE